MHNRNPIKHDNGKKDFRYGIDLEYCGQAKAQYVARFCGEWIGCADNYSESVLLCVYHNDKRFLNLLA